MIGGDDLTLIHLARFHLCASSVPVLECTRLVNGNYKISVLIFRANNHDRYTLANFERVFVAHRLYFIAWDHAVALQPKIDNNALLVNGEDGTGEHVSPLGFVHILEGLFKQ